MIILVWFLAAIYATYSGVRFVLLLIPAFGIALAVGVGRVYEWLSAYVSRELPGHRSFSHVLAFAIIAVLLILPVRAQVEEPPAALSQPSMTHGGRATKIDHEAAKAAIINSWWDSDTGSSTSPDRR